MFNVNDMDLLNEINAKYMELEAEADKALEKANREEEKLQKLEAKALEQAALSHQASKMLSYDEARARNANLLKAIDMAKARLRSRSTFSPVEQILENAIQNYKRDLLNTLSASKEGQMPSTDFRHNNENIYEILE